MHFMSAANLHWSMVFKKTRKNVAAPKCVEGEIWTPRPTEKSKLHGLLESIFERMVVFEGIVMIQFYSLVCHGKFLKFIQISTDICNVMCVVYDPYESGKA